MKQELIKINNETYKISKVVVNDYNYYQVKIKIGTYPNGDAKFKRISAQNLSTLVEKAVKFNEDFNESKVLSFGRVGNEWLEMKKHTVAPATLDKVESVYRVHLLPKLEKVLITNFKEDFIRDFIEDITINGNKNTNGLLSFQTVKKIKSVLSEILDYACRKDYINRNYSKYVSVPTYAAKPKEKTVLNEDDVIRFMDVLNEKDNNGNYTHFYRNAIRFQLVTGMRPCELFGLKKDMVDFKSCCIRIKRDMVRAKNRDEDGNCIGGYTVYCSDSTKNRSSDRIIPLNKETLQILQEQFEVQDTEFVFPNRNGTIVKPGTFNDKFKCICKRAKVDATPYALRHTFATMALYNPNIKIENIAKIMGHSTTKVTETIYMHQLEKNEKQLGNTLYDMFN